MDFKKEYKTSRSSFELHPSTVNTGRWNKWNRLS